MLRLPVSGWEVDMRPLDGTDDLLLLEQSGNAVERALALLGRLARRSVAGERADWPGLCITDFEVLLAAVRQAALGPDLLCVFDCPAPGCGERVEVGFRLNQYVAAVRPRRPLAVLPADRPAWFRLADEALAFRLPTAADQAGVLGARDAASRLAERCLDPPGVAGRARARAEQAMAAMAPEISRPVAGRCPACGTQVRAGLHLPSLVMSELRRAAVGLHDEVHRLAAAYHWQEAAILALPQRRRQAYAERAYLAAMGAA